MDAFLFMIASFTFGTAVLGGLAVAVGADSRPGFDRRGADH